MTGPWLIGCEESQAVTIQLRKLGIEAYSNDVQSCSGGHPEWHLQMDVLEAIQSRQWQVGIFFPPCTYLTYAGIRHFNESVYGQKAIDRKKKRDEAMNFFLMCYNAPIERICVENPVGYPNSLFRPPDQIIEPYYFGDNVKKRTCLWLKGLPKLIHSPVNTIFELASHVQKPAPLKIQARRPGKYYVGGETKNRYFADFKSTMTSRQRSVTFPGIARAMAEQWGGLLHEQNQTEL